MLPASLLKTLESKSQEFFQKHKDILIDIILFGSTVQGKKNPRDVDIVVVFHRKKDLQRSYELRKVLEKAIGAKVDMISKTYEELFEASFTARESLLSEGYSLINKFFLSEGLGYKNRALFIYKLQGKTKSERMRFYHSLHGRTAKGMLHKLKAVKYTDMVLLCPTESRDEMRTYLESWKIEFMEVPVLLPGRVL